MLAGRGGDRPQVVAGAGVHVARLRADDGRRSGCRPRAPRPAPRRPSPRSRVAGTSSIEPSPSPSRRSDRSTVACRSTLATISQPRGSPKSPSRPASQPCAARTCDRPAARPTVLAPPAPVTNPTDAEAGRPSSSFSHEPATSSNAIAAGRERAVEGVLVPAGGEHVGDERRVERAADDEAEVPRPRRAHEARAARRHEIVDHGAERLGPGRHAGRGATATASRARPGRRGRRRASRRYVGDEAGGVVEGALEVVHRAIVEHAVDFGPPRSSSG